MLKKLICLLYIAVSVAFCFVGCENNPGQNSAQPTRFQVSDPTRIQTPYLEILLPEQWKQMLRCEVLQEKENYTLFFYGCVEGKKEMRLFDMIFGQSDAYLLGTLMVRGREVGVYVESYDLDIDETWTEQQRYDILGMQNQINTILHQLMEMDNFTISN